MAINTDKKNQRKSKNAFPLRPLHDRVIVRPDKAEEQTAGGIIIPDTAKERPNRGIVLASGKGHKDLPNETKPGDIVLYGKYAGTEIEHDGETFIIMRESDIIAIDTPTAPAPTE